MQNIPGGRSSSGGRAGSTSHTVPTTQETQIAPTSVGHQSSDLDAYFNLDPTAAFPFIDPVNQTLIGYSTAAIPSHVIMNQHPNQPAHSLIAYQPRVEIQEQLLPNLHPMASCEAAGPPALNYGTYGGYSLGGTEPHSAANGKAVHIQGRSTGGKTCSDMSETSMLLPSLICARSAVGDSISHTTERFI
ncbi:hypothetical protein ACMYSQ_003543 [Aspergillus niger]